MLKLTQRYPKKRAFVTGAASGFGEALCLNLADDGWHLIMTDISDRLEDAAAGVRQKGGQATCKKLNVTDEGAYRDVVKEVIAEQGGIDLVFNNAGVAVTGTVGECSLDDWRWALDINLRGVLYGCHLFAPIMKQQGFGHIANTASLAALLPLPDAGAYCVSKAAVRTLTDVMHGELTGHGVDMTVIMPEFFQTNLATGMRGDVHAAQTKLQGSKFTADDVAKHVLKQMGKRKLHVLFPPKMELVWLAKRTFPTRIMRTLRKVAAIEKKKIDATRPPSDLDSDRDFDRASEPASPPLTPS